MKKLALIMMMTLMGISITNCSLEDGVVAPPNQLQKENKERLSTTDIDLQSLKEKETQKIEEAILRQKQLEQRLEPYRARATQTRPHPRKSNTSRSAGSTLYVPSSDYSDLNSAVNAANPGDEIVVKGTLSNQGVIEIYTPDITIRGEGNASVSGDAIEVRAQGVQLERLQLNLGIVIFESKTKIVNNVITSSIPLTLIDVSKCTIANNEINCSNEYEAFIVDRGGNHTIVNNKISSASSSGGAFPVVLVSSSNNKISNCTAIGEGPDSYDFYIAAESSNNRIQNCRSKNAGIGFINIQSDGNSYSNCTADNHDAGFLIVRSNKVSINSSQANSNIFGMYLLECSNSQILQSTTRNNDYIGIFDFGGGYHNTISGCQADNNFAGISLTSSDGSAAINNRCQGNGFQGINIDHTTNSTLKGNIASNNDDAGISVEYATGTSVENCTAVDNGGCDYQEFGGSGNTLSGNKFGNICI